MLKREVQKSEEEARRNQSIINEYKQICTQLGKRLEEEQFHFNQILQQLQVDPNCSSYLETCSKQFGSLFNNTGVTAASIVSSIVPTDLDVDKIESRTEQRVSSLEDL